jgi:serine/threonine-protein kinase HipA
MIGPMSVIGAERPDALWVVDGQQRLTSLAVSLGRPLPIPTRPIDPFVIYFDAATETFQGPPRHGELPSTWVPLPYLRLERSYVDDPDRPVLGQWFEDHPEKSQVGDRPGELPSFFANLISEGDLGLILRARLGIPIDDDFGLLIAVGNDLPGAVIVRGEVDGASGSAGSPRGAPEHEPSSELRFSLAGVQLKFSMLRTAERFVFPGRDRDGDWIAKIAREDYIDLCQNELVTMEWARRAGFDVPACELRTLSQLVDVPHEADPSTPVFVVQRYDRDGARRIHQEDMQQVVGRRPSKKYDDVTYE